MDAVPMPASSRRLQSCCQCGQFVSVDRRTRTHQAAISEADRRGAGPVSQVEKTSPFPTMYTSKDARLNRRSLANEWRQANGKKNIGARLRRFVLTYSSA